jgi:hypothetical protein
VQSSELRPPPEGCALFFSSSGGHFAELEYVATYFNANVDSRIFTFRSLDTVRESSKFDIVYLPYVSPRKFLPLIKIFPKVYSSIRQNKFDYVASTGASIALIGYVIAKVRRIPYYHVESIARQKTLSKTTKILKMLGIRKFFVQSEDLVNKNQIYLQPQIFQFESVQNESPEKVDSFKIFVALGTIKGFEFKRAVSIVNQLISTDDSISWQLGSTQAEKLQGSVYAELTNSDFLKEIESSDIIICHSGIGILLTCFQLGKKPLVIPRRKEYLEHVDNHQVEIMSALLEKNLIFDLERFQVRDSLNLPKMERIVPLNSEFSEEEY